MEEKKTTAVDIHKKENGDNTSSGITFISGNIRDSVSHLHRMWSVTWLYHFVWLRLLTSTWLFSSKQAKTTPNEQIEYFLLFPFPFSYSHHLNANQKQQQKPCWLLVTYVIVLFCFFSCAVQCLHYSLSKHHLDVGLRGSLFMCLCVFQMIAPENRSYWM